MVLDAEPPLRLASLATSPSGRSYCKWSSEAMIPRQSLMLDAHVASAFGASTGRVSDVVSRNPSKVNASQSFRLTAREMSNLISQSAISSWDPALRSQIATSNGDAALRSQSVISKPGRGGRTHLPWVFTERGVTRVTACDEDQLPHVACTRARDRLLVCGVTPASAFLDDLGHQPTRGQAQ
jgi:hypothetical protein